MKRITRIVTLLLVCSMTIFMACEGPQGPEGPQGQQGQQGPVGPAGEDGSMIHSGSGEPGSGLGSIGDYYLDTDTGDLYGPKDDSGWGSPKIDLQGEDGSQIYSGSGAPDASLGVEGDYYLDKTNYELYGPKTGSGWGTPLDLKGTANVMYSAWSTLDSSVRDTTIDGSDLKVGDLNAPQITQKVLDEGVVNVYMSFSNDAYPLPYTSYAGGVVNTIDFLPRLNLIYITRFAHDNSASVGFASSLEFRYVIIPGGQAAKTKLTKEEIKQLPYEELNKLFSIQE